MKANPQERLPSHLKMVSGDCSFPKETFSLKRSFLISELGVLRSSMYSSHASSAISSNVIIDSKSLICVIKISWSSQLRVILAVLEEIMEDRGGGSGTQSKASWVHRALDWVPSKIELAGWSTLKDRKTWSLQCTIPIKFCIWRHCLWDFYSKPGCSLPFIGVCGNRRSKH